MRTYLKTVLYTFSIAAATLSISEANAQELLSNGEIYAKCYAKISDFPVDTDSATYKNVVAGKITPVAACMTLLNKAMFKKTGTKRELPNKNDVVSRAILRNFNQFHLSWFSSIHSSVNHDPLHAYVDNTEPALFITDALFSQKHFKTTMTSKEPLRGIREFSNPATYIVNTTNLSNSIIMLGPMKSLNPIPPMAENYFDLNSIANKVPIGPLLGIETAPTIQVPVPEFAGRATLTEAQLSSFLYEGTSVNITRHYGGGILGTPSLFLNNVEQYGGMDGGLKVHRRWANGIFYDLLCSSLPSLKETTAEVVKEHNLFKAQKTELPFRGSKTCLTCHTTIDNLAHVARNVHVRAFHTNAFITDFRDAEITDKALRSTDYVFGHTPRKPSIEPIDTDPLYHKRQPDGRVTYIDYDDKLVNVPVRGLQQYGEVLAQQNDIYACAAKRYYYFLTGLDVPLKKPAANDKFATYHRNEVVKLGLKLKSNGSLKSMVQDILNSNSFKARNPAEVGAK